MPDIAGRVRQDGTGRMRLEMFEAEADGLRELAAAEVIRVPAVHRLRRRRWRGVHCDLERSVFRASVMRRPNTALGEQLAALHRHTQGQVTAGIATTRSGRRHSTIPWTEDWIVVLSGAQARVPAGAGGAQRLRSGDMQDRSGERLAGVTAAALRRIRACRHPCCHGDLWSGNWGCRRRRTGIFDPAVYYRRPRVRHCNDDAIRWLRRAHFYRRLREKLADGARA